MRVAEFVNMGRDEVEASLARFDAIIDEEGEEPYDFTEDSGTALLMNTMVLDAFDCVDRGDSIPCVLRVIVGKAFRLGCDRGRHVMAPEERA